MGAGGLQGQREAEHPWSGRSARAPCLPGLSLRLRMLVVRGVGGVLVGSGHRHSSAVTAHAEGRLLGAGATEGHSHVHLVHRLLGDLEVAARENVELVPKFILQYILPGMFF